MALPSLSAAQTPPRHATLILITAVAALTLNLFLPSLPSMAVEFGVSYGAISLSISAYMFCSAGLALVLGPMADRFGRRPVLLTTFGVFTLASVGAAVTQDYTWFLIFRMCQAVSATGATLGRAIVRDIYPAGRGTAVLGFIAMAMSVAPMIGPIVGGFMEETLGWRSTFWLFGLLGLLCLSAIWSDLGETGKGQSKTAADHLQGYIDVMRSSAFWSNTMVLGFSIAAFFVFLAGAPLVAGQIYTLSPSLVGIVMGVTALGFFVGSFVTSRIAEHVSLGKMIVYGRWLALFGPGVALFLVFAQLDTAFLVFALMFTVGAGNGISLAAANTGVMSVRPDLAGSASGLSGAISTAMGGVFSALTGVLITVQNGAWLLCALVCVTCVCALIASYVAAKSFEDIT